MIKAAIFDMDGLLIDSERIIMQACMQAASSVGLSYSQAQYVQLIGRAAADSTRIMTEQLGGHANFSRVMQALDTLLAERDHHYPLKPGVEALLDHYRGLGVVCSVASSSPLHHITERLRRTHLLDRFTHLTSGHEVPRGKPNPDIYLLAMHRLGLSADECIAFEDSEPGACAAIAAGLRVVVVPDLKAPGAFVREHCYRVVDSLDAWLEQAGMLCTVDVD